ncbi:MAG: hypothetical protein ACE3L7_02275 [Candidatus Pristimantibacillus sp.]
MSEQSISDEEFSLIRDYCILPMMIHMVNRNKDMMKNSDYTIKTLFVSSGEVLLRIIEKDLSEVRRKVRKINAKVTEVKRNSEGVMYEIRLRGYQTEVSLVRHVVKNEMSSRLSRYIEGMFKA